MLMIPFLDTDTSLCNRAKVVENAEVVCNRMAFLGLKQFFSINPTKRYSLDLAFFNFDFEHDQFS